MGEHEDSHSKTASSDRVILSVCLPTVSVVIVAYNSRKDLESCLPTVTSQHVDHEIIVVDNGSTDGTANWLQEDYPEVRLVETGNNGGYAVANNIGVQFAQGVYILILNPDTELYPGVLEQLVQVAKDNPNTLVTPKLLQQDGTINACGNKMHFTGITTCNGIGQHPEEYNGVFPVLLLSGAAFLVHRDTWRDIGGFDPDYFMYMEDVDFSLRARMLGYHIVCCAESPVLHKWKLGLSAQKFFYLERNRLVTLLKLYQKETFLKLCVFILLTELATWAYAFMKGPAFIKARVTTYLSLWSMRTQLKLSRSEVQARRKISDDQLLSQMSSALPFDMVVSPLIAKVLVKTITPVYDAFKFGGDGT